MRIKLLLSVLAAFVLTACAASMTTLYAQSLPATLKARWDPNPVGDNVVAYKVTVDAAAPVMVPLSACTATDCTQTFQVGTAGGHSVTVVATNLALSSDPTSGQDSPPLTVTFVLNSAASQPKNGKVTK